MCKTHTPPRLPYYSTLPIHVQVVQKAKVKLVNNSTIRGVKIAKIFQISPPATDCRRGIMANFP